MTRVSLTTVAPAAAPHHPHLPGGLGLRQGWADRGLQQEWPRPEAGQAPSRCITKHPGFPLSVFIRFPDSTSILVITCPLLGPEPQTVLPSLTGQSAPGHSCSACPAPLPAQTLACHFSPESPTKARPSLGLTLTVLQT